MVQKYILTMGFCLCINFIITQSLKIYLTIYVRGGSRIFERGGSILGLQAKSGGGGGPGGGPNLGQMLKSLHCGPRGGGVLTPWTPLPDPPMYVIWRLSYEPSKFRRQVRHKSWHFPFNAFKEKSYLFFSFSAQIRSLYKTGLQKASMSWYLAKTAAFY